jgi:hypothetical protein
VLQLHILKVTLATFDELLIFEQEKHWPVVLSMKELASGQVQVLLSTLKTNDGLHLQVLFVRRSPVPFFPLSLEHEKHTPVGSRTASDGQAQSFNLAFQIKVGLHSHALALLLTLPVPFVVLSAQEKQSPDELIKVLVSVQTQLKLSVLNVKVGLH